jgi:transcriptional regulator with XRE-family HTH domain
MSPQEVMPRFGELLRRERQRAGLTQEELARQARISPRSLRNLETGAVRFPHRSTLRLLVEALSLDGETLAAFEAEAGGLTAGPNERSS